MARRRPLIAAFAIAAVVVGCDRGPSERMSEHSKNSSDPPAAAQVSSEEDEIFSERGHELGLRFNHFNGMFGEQSIVEEMGSGGALVDYDKDGDLDVYLVQGRMFDPRTSIEDALFPPRHPLPLTDRLYRNDLDVAGSGVRFTDITEQIGLPAAGYGIGVAAGDVDNDGWTDLYLTNYGSNQLLRNRGDGGFEDITRRSGADDDRWSVPAVFFDYDRDGWLDLFVGNYVYFPLLDPPECRDMTGGRDYCGPDNFSPLPDRLFHNRGDGTFEIVTEKAGLTGGFGPALGAVTADLNGDGWPDLYVANDAKPNNYWANSEGVFSDQALLAGLAVNADGMAEASMGVDAADFDRDGDIDLFMTHFITETNTLYANDGSGMFEDRTTYAGLGTPSRVYTSFGTGWLDFDNDGWLDLFVVNGAVNNLEALVRQGDPYPLHQPNQLFRGSGEGRFEEVKEGVEPLTSVSEVSRGAVFGDLDNDGDTDVVVLNNNGPARLLVNNSGNRNRWIGFRLVEGDPPRDSLGARLALLRDGKEVLWSRARVDGSYCSANDPRILMGLGTETAFEAVRVFWPDGKIEEWGPPSLRRYTTLVRGSGQVMRDRT